MENQLPKLINRSKSIKILNIAFTYFLEPKSKELIKKKIINDNSDFEILITKRKRKKDDMSFLILRERDEKNWGLRKGMNETLFQLFIFMLTELSSHQREGINLHHKIKIIEYPYCPVMCMYIFDDKDIIFGPYLSKDCESIPMFHLKKRIYRQELSMAYNEIDEHYSILSKPESRNYKEYVPDFCYYDCSYLFSWDDIPKQANEKLIEFLKNLKIDWVQRAIIEKIDNGKTIKAFTEDNYLTIRLNDEETMANFEINGKKPIELTVIKENGKLNIYKCSNVSIHNFIDKNSPNLSKYLTDSMKTKYEQYLIDEGNEEFHDSCIRDLGKEALEGRFDAVMRHIAIEIQKMD